MARLWLEHKVGFQGMDGPGRRCMSCAVNKSGGWCCFDARLRPALVPAKITVELSDDK